MSKSCSDKLAMKQCTGLTSGLTSLLIDPGSVYLDEVVLPESQYVKVAVDRAFGRHGRMKDLARVDVNERWKRAGGFDFRPFEVKTTKTEFAFSRRSGSAAGGDGLVASNLSAMYTPRKREILINGVLQGRKQFDPRGASCVSRRGVWQGVLDVAVMAGMTGLLEVLRTSKTYTELKSCEELAARRNVKKEAKEMALKGWVTDQGDAHWGLEEA
jgi:tRNA-specific adenosine deaminase 1